MELTPLYGEKFQLKDEDTETEEEIETQNSQTDERILLNKHLKNYLKENLQPEKGKICRRMIFIIIIENL